MVNLQDRRQEGVPFPGDAPASGSLDFGDQSVGVQSLEQSGDVGAGPFGMLGLPSGGDKLLSDISITEALEQVFAAHHGGEEPDVLGRGGIEPAMGSPVLADRVGQGLNLLACDGRVIRWTRAGSSMARKALSSWR